MTVYELSTEQISELKSNYLCLHLEETEGRTPSWGELAEADSTVPDATIYEEYQGTEFTEDDFMCTASSGDWDTDEAVADLSSEVGYYINPAVLAI